LMLGWTVSPRSVICPSPRSLLRGEVETFWQAESYDHWVRDADEVERIIHYVENNPVKAGLINCPENWLYSSAYLRIRGDRSPDLSDKNRPPRLY